ncbi:MAG: hypothetical protein R3E01_16530 [Pirellulaceae bacterium]|nr:hypothetical protein [Planctomycetales bacterium]
MMIKPPGESFRWYGKISVGHWLIITFVLVAGCQRGGGTIAGQITLDGRPLEGGWITFRPTQEGPSAAAEIKDGHYELPRDKPLTPGAYEVSIEYTKKTGRMIKHRDYPDEEIEETVQVVPARYHSPTTLTRDIDGKSGSFDFDLQTK